MTLNSETPSGKNGGKGRVEAERRKRTVGTICGLAAGAVTLASHIRRLAQISAALLQTRLPVNVPGKEDRTQGSCHRHGSPGRCSWLLAMAWPSPGFTVMQQ